MTFITLLEHILLVEHYDCVLLCKNYLSLIVKYIWWKWSYKWPMPTYTPCALCACVQVYDCWHYWLIVWGSSPSSSHNKIRTSSGLPALVRPCLSAVISWSTQINCHLISFPGFVVAEMCGPGRGRWKLSTFLMCFDHQPGWEREAGGLLRLKVNLVGCLCN